MVNLSTYEGKYPNSLFNKGVRAKNDDDIGYVIKETPDKIVVFGYSNQRFDISKSHIMAGEWSCKHSPCVVLLRYLKGKVLRRNGKTF